MTGSIRSADSMTHIKIVVVSLVAAIAVVTIGINARNFGIDVDNPAATKAGKALDVATKDSPTVR